MFEKKFFHQNEDYYDRQVLICDTFNKKLGLLFGLYPHYEEIPRLVEIAEKYQIKEVVGELSYIWDEENQMEEIIEFLENDHIKIVSNYEND